MLTRMHATEPNHSSIKIKIPHYGSIGGLYCTINDGAPKHFCFFTNLLLTRRAAGGIQSWSQRWRNHTIVILLRYILGNTELKHALIFFIETCEHVAFT